MNASVNSAESMRTRVDTNIESPQVGGTGFIASGCLFMLEVQPQWYKPAPQVLGWHIGLWNLVGALGFTACGALGFAAGNRSIEYASTLATFIGSWAFLVCFLPAVVTGIVVCPLPIQGATVYAVHLALCYPLKTRGYRLY